MTTRTRMERQELIDFLIKGQWYFMFTLSTLFGVISNEAFFIIKYPSRPKWRNFIFKVIISCFVCLLAHAWYDYRGYTAKYEYVAILLASFLHYPIAFWLIHSLFPLLTKLIIGSIKQGKDE